MLVSSSFQLSKHVTQASLGDAMNWLVIGERSVAYIDGCSLADVSLLERRLKGLVSRLELDIGNPAAGIKQHFRLFTGDREQRLCFPESIERNSIAILTDNNQSEGESAASDLPENIRAQSILAASNGETSGRKFTPLGTREFAAAGTTLDLGGVSIRRIPLGLAQTASAGYLIEPDGVLVIDESAGFFRGREMPAPGATTQLLGSVERLRELAKLNISALGLPWGGALTGALAARHLTFIADVTAALVEDFKLQVSSQIPNVADTTQSRQRAADFLSDLSSELEAQLYSPETDGGCEPSAPYHAALKRACRGTVEALLREAR